MASQGSKVDFLSYRGYLSQHLGCERQDSHGNRKSTAVPSLVFFQSNLKVPHLQAALEGHALSPYNAPVCGAKTCAKIKQTIIE